MEKIEIIVTTPDQLATIIRTTVLECLKVIAIGELQILQPKEKKLIRGIKGLANYLGISLVTAQNIKNSGKISYTQFGRIVLFDEDTLRREMAAIGKPSKRRL